MQAPQAVADSFDDPGFDEDLPASWETKKGKGYKKNKRVVRKKRPWFKPRFALGGGVNLPEFVPIEAYMFFGKYFAIRGFYTPPLPFNIRVEMPSDILSTKKKIGVANPDFTIKFKAVYGPQYGFEGLYFPTGKSFFVSGGGSFRQIELSGHTKSPLYVCSLQEVAKNPPCGDESKRLTTSTQIELAADTITTSLVARGAMGWMWDVGRVGYFTLYGGYAKPFNIKKNASITANLDSPQTEDEALTGALEQFKAEKEAELRDKALSEIGPSTEKPLPILGISFGVRF